MRKERDSRRAAHDALVQQITRDISDIGSGRREPVRPVRTSDGAFSRVRLTREEPAAVDTRATTAHQVKR